MRLHTIIAGFTMAGLVGIAVPDASAATVGHWNFEAESFANADIGPNNLGLEPAGDPPGNPSRVQLSALATASSFPDPVPQTGTANEYAASVSGSNNFVTTATGSVLNVQSFTVEAFIRPTASSSSANQYIIGRSRSSDNNRSWDIGRAKTSSPTGGTANALFMLINDTGQSGGQAIVGSGLVLDQNDDYYIAVSFDVTTGTNDVTFYVQNLTDNGPLLTATVSSGKTALWAPTGVPLEIGTRDGSSSNVLTGLIDEVRLSDTVLSQSQLLVVPEPASLSLLGLGGLFLARRRHA